MSSLCIAGASGYIGSEFVRECGWRGYELHVIDRSIYTNFDSLLRYLRKYQHNLLINCAAYVPAKGVDYCEDDKLQTLQVNALLPVMMSNACEATNTLMCHVSTGCLYQGDNNGEGWRETDEPQLGFHTKCGFYVGSKHLAEQYLKDKGHVYVCRVRLPFDEFDHPRNLLTKLATYPVVVDEIQSVAHRGDFVKACLDLWKRGAARGLYNCTNEGAVRYRDLVGLLVKQKIRTTQVMVVPPEVFDKALARTPKSRCVLNVDKLEKAVRYENGIPIRDCGQAICDAINRWTKA